MSLISLHKSIISSLIKMKPSTHISFCTTEIQRIDKMLTDIILTSTTKEDEVLLIDNFTYILQMIKMINDHKKELIDCFSVVSESLLNSVVYNCFNLTTLQITLFFRNFQTLNKLTPKEDKVKTKKPIKSHAIEKYLLSITLKNKDSTIELLQDKIYFLKQHIIDKEGDIAQRLASYQQDTKCYFDKLFTSLSSSLSEKDYKKLNVFNTICKDYQYKIDELSQQIKQQKKQIKAQEALLHKKSSLSLYDRYFIEDILSDNIHYSDYSMLLDMIKHYENRISALKSKLDKCKVL
ncbi:hypothetical protein AB837_00470 [bacterium AB1]|nr:hypothetical protein AB837_00470 [bacterium AB1]